MAELLLLIAAISVVAARRMTPAQYDKLAALVEPSGHTLEPWGWAIFGEAQKAARRGDAGGALLLFAVSCYMIAAASQGPRRGRLTKPARGRLTKPARGRATSEQFISGGRWRRRGDDARRTSAG